MVSKEDYHTWWREGSDYPLLIYLTHPHKKHFVLSGEVFLQAYTTWRITPFGLLLRRASVLHHITHFGLLGNLNDKCVIDVF